MLASSGFEILLVTDFRYPAFLTTEAEFERHWPGDICFVYYAGYTQCRRTTTITFYL